MASASPPGEKEGDAIRAVSGEVDDLPAFLGRRQWARLCRRYALTPREEQIVQLVCRGLRNGHIARELNVRPGTVKTHVRNIYRKMRVNSRIHILLRFVAESRPGTGDRDDGATTPERD